MNSPKQFLPQPEPLNSSNQVLYQFGELIGTCVPDPLCRGWAVEAEGPTETWLRTSHADGIFDGVEDRRCQKQRRLAHRLKQDLLFMHFQDQISLFFDTDGSGFLMLLPWRRRLLCHWARRGAARQWGGWECHQRRGSCRSQGLEWGGCLVVNNGAAPRWRGRGPAWRPPPPMETGQSWRGHCKPV